MIILGSGMGLVMPALTLAGQNAVPFRDLGAATATNNFLRSLGGAIGVAAFGAILSNRLTAELADRLPAAIRDRAGDGALAAGPEQIALLPDAIRIPVVESIAASVHTVFLSAIPVMVLAFVVGWFLRELPLRESNVPEAAPETAPLETGAGPVPAGADAPAARPVPPGTTPLAQPNQA
jgi:hypothetical protein